MFANSPLHNPLPALRWRGEETRGAGLVDALEMAHSFEARIGFKPSDSPFLHAIFAKPKVRCVTMRLGLLVAACMAQGMVG